MTDWDSFDSWSHYYNRQPTTAEACLYEHLQWCRVIESPDEVLTRFYKLFLDAFSYPDTEVWKALTDIVRSPNADTDFKYTLNRCCYILINYWQSQRLGHAAIPQLIGLFEALPQEPANQKITQEIRQRVGQFTQSEHYAALNRLKQVFISEEATPQDHQPLTTLIRRYPFIYDCSLTTKDSDNEQKQSINRLRRQAEKKLGLNLVRYQLSHNCSVNAANPTLLNDTELNRALHYYTKPTYGFSSLRDQAMYFNTYSKTVRSYREFKYELSDYLIAPIAAVEPAYRNNPFARSLRQHLKDTLTDFDEQRLNTFMLVETCRRLLNFLIVDSKHQPSFETFKTLIQHLGYNLTIGLLLRIVLFCSQSRAWLERCFSLLFNLHEHKRQDSVSWLVNSMEHMNVGLITNFSQMQPITLR